MRGIRSGPTTRAPPNPASGWRRRHRRSKRASIRRASALIVASWATARQGDEAANKEAERLANASLALLPESLREDGDGPESRDIWFGNCQDALRIHKQITGDSQAAFDKVDAFLAREPRARALRLTFRGDFMGDYAWEARGSGFANRVTEDGFRKFASRLAESRKALDQAWALSPGDGKIAAERVRVELGIGEGDRAKMEVWFKRAMEADNDNYRACWLEMEWLHPKWHGDSLDDVVAFGRACRDTRNWRSKIPLLVAQAHFYQALAYKQGDQFRYYRADEVWNDIFEVYTEYLKQIPSDLVARSEFAAFSYLRGRLAFAHELFKAMEGKVVPTRNFSQKWLDTARDFCANAVRSGAAAAAPRRRAERVRVP